MLRTRVCFIPRSTLDLQQEHQLRAQVRHLVDQFCRRIEEESIWRSDPVEPALRVPNDDDDDYLVALALESEADVLVSGDKRLEGLRFHNLRIEFPGVFLAAIDD